MVDRSAVVCPKTIPNAHLTGVLIVEGTTSKRRPCNFVAAVVTSQLELSASAILRKVAYYLTRPSTYRIYIRRFNIVPL